MFAIRIAVLAIIGCAWIGSCNSVWADPPNFLPFRARVQADPDKRYVLTDRNGPWLIMVGSFSGAEGERQANDLVIEIRKELRMPAYVYRHRFNFDETTEGLGWQPPPDGRGDPIRQRMKLLNLQDFDEIAVLVGDFDSHDNNKIQKSLQRLKEMQPDSLNGGSNPRASDAFRQRRNKMHFGMDKEKELGPLRAAFITPNPMIPEQYFNPDGPDKFVFELNKDLDYSLLRCQRDFTLKVATFKGDSSFDLNEIEQKNKEFNIKKMLGQPIKSKLAEAADKAHRLTVALRERGVEAYEFHDRYSSFVSVGSFDDLTVLGPDGRQQWNPELVNLMQTFQPQRIDGLIRDAAGHTKQGAIKPFTLKGYEELPFDLSPEPIEVPRYSVARDYARDGRELR